jgi:hypothetical protein
LSVLLNSLIGAGSGTVVVSACGAFLVRQLKHIAGEAVREGIKEIGNDLISLKLKIANEVGGNSNGIRQKMNEVDSKVDAIAVDVAHLKGTLGQPHSVVNVSTTQPSGSA